MANIDVIAVSMANSYTDEEIAGGGAIKGKNCTIASITEITGGHRVTFKWYLDNGIEKTGTMDVKDGQGADGRGIKSSYVDENNHFIIVYDDDTEEDCGEITIIGVNELSQLADVDLTGVQDGNALVYDAETSKWTPGQGGGGGTSDYSDLSNKPSIESITLSGNKTASDLGLAKSSDLASVATSGSYADVSNKPSIEDVTLSGNKTASDLGLVKASSLASVATSGSYNDLSNKPSIPDELADLADDANHRLTTDTEKTAWNAKSVVGVTQVLSTGTKIATVSVNGAGTDLYAPDGGSGHAIKNSSGTVLTQRDTLQFGSGLNVSDDSTSEATVVEPDVLQSADMADIVSPLPSYSGGNSNPTGTIISFMGTIAPQGYLACDGSTKNISSYPRLANFFLVQFGSVNYFGGDGTTTFAVPDLRGEFLRGTGTNSHTNQGSGANVGTHQDSTQVPFLGTYLEDITQASKIYIDLPQTTWENSKNGTLIKRSDGIGNQAAKPTHYVRWNADMTYESSANTGEMNVRPTNTSVLYCIKD